MSLDNRIGVLIVDHDAFVRAGLRALLHDEPDMRVVGEATSSRAAIGQSIRLVPDVIVFDASLASGSVDMVCRGLRARLPRPRILMLVDRADPGAVLAAVRSAAEGCLSRDADLEEVRRVVRTVAAGESGVDRHALAVVLDYVRRLPAMAEGEPASLTEVERQVLALVAAGRTNKEIAAALALSEKSVKNRLGHAFDKLRVTRRAEAAVRYMAFCGTPDRDSIA
jgi:DNA-binding NarL/FixJ family response regulator